MPRVWLRLRTHRAVNTAARYEYQHAAFRLVIHGGTASLPGQILLADTTPPAGCASPDPEPVRRPQWGGLVPAVNRCRPPMLASWPLLPGTSAFPLRFLTGRIHDEPP